MLFLEIEVVMTSMRGALFVRAKVNLFTRENARTDSIPKCGKKLLAPGRDLGSLESTTTS